MFIFITFCIVTLIQILFFSFFFFYFLGTISSRARKYFPVSIIICAKNEAKNLVRNLPFIAQQNYPNFEIVLVDDFSTDDSMEIMEHFKRNFSTKNVTIKILRAPKSSSKGKKNALSWGIQNASHNYLLLTDADCRPNSNDWIGEMVSQFSDKKTIVLGYGAYHKIKNSMVNKIIRFETLLTAMQYFSYAKAGKTYMGVGRNIAYKKEIFFMANGFEKHANVISGDDDLFINQMATSKNMAICLHPNGFTISEPKLNLKNWITQKRRHISTATQYKLFHQFSLGIFYLSQILFWTGAILLLLLNVNPAITIILILFRFIIWYLAISKSAKKLQEKDLIRLAPFYEFSLIFIQLYIFIRNLISPPKHW